VKGGLVGQNTNTMRLLGTAERCSSVFGDKTFGSVGMFSSDYCGQNVTGLCIWPSSVYGS
jgi:hypothetical protein